MPVGIQRLNARRTQPNPNIVFIKPLPGPDSQLAEKFLERIAAQCRMYSIYHSCIPLALTNQDLHFILLHQYSSHYEATSPFRGHARGV